ncbi:MAG: hypothetical protein PWP37_429 [Thermotogota bacterium]|nr:hypothetical protein [Thermotogota bacterium]HCZ07197.1 hypothetical protein [Thermotogota bacterium]
MTLLPLVAPVFFSFVALATRGLFLYDFLMPMELFLLSLIGGIGMVVLSKLRGVKFRKLLIFLVLLVADLLATQAYANLSGLAHGDTEPVGIHLLMIVVFVSLYHLFAVMLMVNAFVAVKRFSRG